GMGGARYIRRLGLRGRRAENSGRSSRDAVRAAAERHRGDARQQWRHRQRPPRLIAGFVDVSDPAITVVSAALNSARTLPRAIRSLDGQGVPYEWILVDGGSKDDTMAIATAAPHSRPISFPGSSIYEAWNRGIEEARAPLVVLLNTDDALLPGALAAWIAA